MEIIHSKEYSPIPLGRVGENNARKIIFDISRWMHEFPHATIILFNQLASATAAYPVTNLVSDLKNATWTIMSMDVGAAGEGKCELVAVNNDVIVKSKIFTTITEPALDTSAQPPEPWDFWATQFVQWKDEAQAAVADAEAAAEDAHQCVAEIEGIDAVAQTLLPGEAARATYQNGLITIYVPQGLQGPQGHIGITFIPEVSEEGILSWTNDGGYPNPSPVNIKGPKGDTYTLTAQDKADIAEEVQGMFTVTIQDTDAVISANKNTRYICGTLDSLVFTPSVEGISSVRFTSGETATVLTLPNTVKMPDWWIGVDPNTIYEINIADGVYGAVMSWQA